MSKRTNTVGSLAIALLALSAAVSAQTNLTAKAGSIQPQPVIGVADSDRIRDGLVGPVRRVRTETAKLSNDSGKLTESKRVTLETAAYDLKGNKTENQYFPIAGATLTGKEVYKYDEKGNISEMTLLNGDGSLMSREVYNYEYDFAGNWNKMTTSVAVVDSGKLTFEPTEVTYRSIMYYLDENMLKTVQPEGAPAIQPAPANNAANVGNSAANVGNTADVAKVNTETKTQPMTGKPTNRNTSTSLPLPTVSTSSLDGVTPMEVKTVNANSNAPVVLLDAEPPASPARKPILKPVSGGVLNGTALSLPAPIYPEAAKRMRASGLVSVEVILDENGKVISANATSGPAMLRDVSVQAALKARFSPTKLSGQPVKVAGVINYKFALIQ
jgi:TonB family protein